MEDLEKYFDEIVDLIVLYGASVLLAIIVLIIGLWVIKRLVKLMGKAMNKRNLA